jgi:hypothetical protein
MKARETALVGALSAIALAIFVLEAQIPPVVPLPGVKLGLANVVTLTTMAVLGRRDAGLVLLVRVILGSLFAGSPSTILFSACGGALAWAAMAALIGLFPEKLLWVVIVLAAHRRRICYRHALHPRLCPGPHGRRHRGRRFHRRSRRLSDKGAEKAESPYLTEEGPAFFDLRR